MPSNHKQILFFTQWDSNIEQTLMVPHFPNLQILRKRLIIAIEKLKIR